ncbi:MAG TPA: metal ABC transporter permease [Steroidobacteraceae bacterium]|nr:metal ABC transporter permease [Steroidobacteraceae bacterium]
MNSYLDSIVTNFSILWPALIAGILVSLSHVPLGQQVLRRGIVFIDLAIAQVAGVGVVAAHYMGLELQGWMTQFAAVTAALGGALVLTWTERKRPEVQEALIGVMFVVASTVQILLLANDPHGGEDLKDLLAGQILWVTPEQLWRAAIVTAAFLALWWTIAQRLGRIGFYVLFAVVVTVSVQLVGVYLVFTSLIVPAIATYRHPPQRQLWLGIALAVLSYVVGLVLSAITDLPTSALVVPVMVVIGAIVHLASPRNAVHSLTQPGALETR